MNSVGPTFTSTVKKLSYNRLKMLEKALTSLLPRSGRVISLSAHNLTKLPQMVPLIKRMLFRWINTSLKMLSTISVKLTRTLQLEVITNQWLSLWFRLWVLWLNLVNTLTKTSSHHSYRPWNMSFVSKISWLTSTIRPCWERISFQLWAT